MASVDGESGATIQIPIVAASPGLFFSGANVGVIAHANGSLVTTASPANPGETITLYATGLGATNPVVPTGEKTPANVTLVTAPTVTIDSLPATVSLAGRVSGSIGVDSVNVQVPSAVHTGTNVNVVVTTGGQRE